MKSFTKMAQEISVVMNREYPGINLPITSKVTRVLFSQKEEDIKEFLNVNSNELIQYPVLYKYLKKNIPQYYS
jgi:hypothetical protein